MVIMAQSSLFEVILVGLEARRFTMRLLRLSALLIALFVIVAMDCGNAAQHTVGRTAGWTIPAVGNVNYSHWVTGFTFVLGDELVFKFDATLHDVMRVSQFDYDNCNAIAPLATYLPELPPQGATSVVIVTLDTIGDWYFICGVPGHCLAGQKFSVQVFPPSPLASPSPSPSMSTTPALPLVPIPSPKHPRSNASSSLNPSLAPPSVVRSSPSSRSHPSNANSSSTNPPHESFLLTSILVVVSFSLITLWRFILDLDFEF